MKGAWMLAVAAALTSGCVLSAEAELPEVEVTQHDISMPGVPREARTTDPTVTLPSFFQPTDHLGLSPDSWKSVKVKSVTVQLKSSGDLSFVRTLDVTVNGLQGFLAGVSPVDVGRYERPGAGAVGANITMTNGSAVEVTDAWRDSMTVLTVTASGDLPEQDWTFDVIVRASATVSY
jgi:hypothetical protein